MVNVYIKERINDQKTICAGGVTSNTTYLGSNRYSGRSWVQLLLGNSKIFFRLFDLRAFLHSFLTGNYYLRTVSSLKMVIQRYFSVMEFDAQ